MTPYHYVYLNLFAGKYSENSIKFENDYWGVSLRELIKKSEFLNQDYNKLALCGVSSGTVKYYLKKFKYSKVRIVRTDEKFDYIINDVSGISSIVAKNSPWYGDKIPCDSGEDGSNLALSIIKNAAIYLTKKGSIQIPLISLSNVQKIVNVAEKNFSETKIIKSKDWFLPKEMEGLKGKMNELKSKNYINFDEKFTTERGRINCSLNDKEGWRWLGVQYVIFEY